MRSILASSTTGAQAFLAFSIVTTFTALVFTTAQFNWGLFVLGYFLYGCLGVVITFHRYHTHRGFDMHPALVRAFSLLGCLAGTGSPQAWTAIHINHHLNSDKESDPHSPKYQGLKMFFLDYEGNLDAKTKWRMREMIADHFLQVLHRYYFGILALWGAILIAFGGIDLLISLFLAPAAFTAIMSNVVNYFGHVDSPGAYRRHNLNDNSVNNWIWAIPSWGEAWHNTHHRFPKRYTFSERWWEIDIAGLVIRLVGKPKTF